MPGEFGTCVQDSNGDWVSDAYSCGGNCATCNSDDDCTSCHFGDVLFPQTADPNKHTCIPTFECQVNERRIRYKDCPADLMTG